MLAAAEQSALLTVTQYSASGSQETPELSADIILARNDNRLYVFTRDPGDPEHLVSQGLDEDEVRELIRSLAMLGDWDTQTAIEPPSGRIARIGTMITRRLRREEPAAPISKQSTVTK